MSAQGRRRTFPSVAAYTATRDALIGVVSPTRVVQSLGEVLAATTHPTPVRPRPTTPKPRPSPRPTKEVPR